MDADAQSLLPGSGKTVGHWRSSADRNMVLVYLVPPKSYWWMSCAPSRWTCVQEITDRMVAFGGRGRLITASSAGYQDQCRTTAELLKSDFRQWFVKCPNCGRESIAAWEGFHFKKGPPALHHAVLWDHSRHPWIRWGSRSRTVEGDGEAHRSEDPWIPPRLLQRICV